MFKILTISQRGSFEQISDRKLKNGLSWGFHGAKIQTIYITWVCRRGLDGSRPLKLGYLARSAAVLTFGMFGKYNTPLLILGFSEILNLDVWRCSGASGWRGSVRLDLGFCLVGSKKDTTLQTNQVFAKHVETSETNPKIPPLTPISTCWDYTYIYIYILIASGISLTFARTTWDMRVGKSHDLSL